MDLLKEITDWKSIRKYLDKPVEDEKITQCLQAARRAPSWENYQPWHFIVITNPEIKSLLTELSGGQKLIQKAPVVILVASEISCFSEDKARKQLLELIEAISGKPANEDFVNKAFIDRPLMTPSKLGDEIVFARALEQLSYAISFMILQASHVGLGTCVVGAFGNKATKQMPEMYDKLIGGLNLPDDILPLVLVTMGYPDENPKSRPRKDFNKICHREKFSNPWS
jgi:nitroreductase